MPHGRPSVRRAAPEDIAELVRLRALMVAGSGRPDPVDTVWREHAECWFRERMRHDRDWVCVVAGAAPGERLVACGVAWIAVHLPGPDWPDGRRGYVEGMCTDPAMRRRGHASRILTALLSWLRESGVGVVELSASPDGAPLYRAFGFSDATHPLMRLHWLPAHDTTQPHAEVRSA